MELYRRLEQFCIALKPGGIEKKHMAKYIAFCEGKRAFCSVHLFRGGMKVWLKLTYHRIPSPPSFARDVAGIGHWGLGDVEVAIANAHQLSETEPLIKKSFEGQ